MQKIKMTRNDARGPYTFRTGYCDLSEICRGLDPVGYNCGVYGWNWDCYNFGGVTITTGYRGMVGDRIPSALLRKYKKQAEKIGEDYYKEGYKYKYNYAHLLARLEKLRARFAAELRAL